ncbi:HTH-type transcriptional repressor AseR [Cedecea lapagei]|uniref:Arsenical resistance operon repressor n=1 Tax=Cedecea lapagei TaxID=158823 RepID=A0A447V1G6_9ENTR|nr:metalloregulator ArsR/SmtB family transcription factor [Cedecea lapagei]VEB97080.1 HTH-type transcriptional repressor AseR [Cedecea lapagei]
MTALTPLLLFKHLSEETRLSITLMLKAKTELCVCDLTAALEQPQPKVSRHLAMLRGSGLLQDRREGKWVYYRLSPHMPAWAAAVIEQAWLSEGHGVLERMKHLEASGAMAGCR